MTCNIYLIKKDIVVPNNSPSAKQYVPDLVGLGNRWTLQHLSDLDGKSVSIDWLASYVGGIPSSHLQQVDAPKSHSAQPTILRKVAWLLLLKWPGLLMTVCASNPTGSNFIFLKSLPSLSLSCLRRRPTYSTTLTMFRKLGSGTGNTQQNLYGQSRLIN
jgi:hypothetical protein